jgi:hypothetical protein
MRKRMMFRGDMVLDSRGYFEMAEAYAKASQDPRLNSEKRQEYLEKAKEIPRIGYRHHKVGTGRTRQTSGSKIVVHPNAAGLLPF